MQLELPMVQPDPARAAMLIIPDGHRWLRGEGQSAVAAIREIYVAGAPVEAIDSGVLTLARAGLLDRCRHTGNGFGQIASEVPSYAGAEQYDSEVLAVSDGGVITASHLGSVEFA